MNKWKVSCLLVVWSCLLALTLTYFIMLADYSLASCTSFGLASLMLFFLIVAHISYLFEHSSGISIKSGFKENTLNENQYILFFPLNSRVLDKIGTDHNIKELNYRLENNELCIVKNCGIFHSQLLTMKLGTGSYKLFSSSDDISKLDTPGLCIFFDLDSDNRSMSVIQHAFHCSINAVFLKKKSWVKKLFVKSVSNMKSHFRIFYNLYIDALKDKESLKRFLLINCKYKGEHMSRYVALIKKIFMSFPSNEEEKKAWISTNDGKNAVYLLTTFSCDEMLLKNKLEDNLNVQVNYVLDCIKQRNGGIVPMNDDRNLNCLFPVLRDLLFEVESRMNLYRIMFKNYFLEKTPDLMCKISEDIMCDDLSKYILAIASYNYGNVVETNKNIRRLLNDAGCGDVIKQVDTMLDRMLKKKIVTDLSYCNSKIPIILERLGVNYTGESYTGENLIISARRYLQKKYMSHMLLDEIFKPVDLGIDSIRKICLFPGRKTKISIADGGCKQLRFVENSVA